MSWGRGLLALLHWRIHIEHWQRNPADLPDGSSSVARSLGDRGVGDGVIPNHLLFIPYCNSLERLLESRIIHNAGRYRAADSGCQLPPAGRKRPPA